MQIGHIAEAANIGEFTDVLGNIHFSSITAVPRISGKPNIRSMMDATILHNDFACLLMRITLLINKI